VEVAPIVAPSARRHEIGVVDSEDGPVVVHAMEARARFLRCDAMPRSLKEILDQADEFADRFERVDPDAHDAVDAESLRVVRAASEERAAAEARLAEAVSVARAEGHSWSAIGAMVGTSGEAARQRYGRLAGTRSA